MTEEKPLNEIPTPDWKDRSRDLAIILSGFIPAVPASEFLDKFWPDALAKRQQEWHKRISEGLLALQQQFNILPETLAENEVFKTALFEATWIAMRQHQEEQLSYLRNMVLNSAIPNSLDESFQKTFFRMINTFSPWHIKILEFYSLPDWPQRLGIGNPYFSVEAEDIGRYFPELKEQEEFYKLIIDDLDSAWLLKGNKPTKLGKQFLNFIKSPLK